VHRSSPLPKTLPVGARTTSPTLPRANSWNEITCYALSAPTRLRTRATACESWPPSLCTAPGSAPCHPSPRARLSLSRVASFISFFCATKVQMRGQHEPRSLHVSVSCCVFRGYSGCTLVDTVCRADGFSRCLTFVFTYFLYCTAGMTRPPRRAFRR
jgi:hypothetical protein